MSVTTPDQSGTNAHASLTKILNLRLSQIDPNPFSISIYGESSETLNDLLPSIRDQGILVPLTVAPGSSSNRWEILSGHRRLACARSLGFTSVPCSVRSIPPGPGRHQAILEYNKQRRKTFSQLMREADAFETLWKDQANARRLANLQNQQRPGPEEWASDVECRNSDTRATTEARAQTTDLPQRGRTDAAIASEIGIGGKDLYRQARAIWKQARSGDIRATASIRQLDEGTKSIHSAYKDLRRRHRFSTNFKPTPYDVWAFRHDRAFGIPHPGSIPPAIVAHALHYFSAPNDLVVDPMAGGGTTIDVCQSMGRRCLAYDLHPTRPDITEHNIRSGFPTEAHGCNLIFCDPPYHSMLAQRYAPDSVASAPLTEWIAFLNQLTKNAFLALKPGGYLLLLLAPQTEKDLPPGFGYLDHAFFGYIASIQTGFLPERRISCPMDGAYHPQQVHRARATTRLLGQVRDLLVMRKPTDTNTYSPNHLPFMQYTGASPDRDVQESS
jgi:ParB/RepB/Spo0J family partition protein